MGFFKKLYSKPSVARTSFLSSKPKKKKATKKVAKKTAITVGLLATKTGARRYLKRQIAKGANLPELLSDLKRPQSFLKDATHAERVKFAKSVRES